MRFDEGGECKWCKSRIDGGAIVWEWMRLPDKGPREPGETRICFDCWEQDRVHRRSSINVRAAAYEWSKLEERYPIVKEVEALP